MTTETQNINIGHTIEEILEIVEKIGGVPVLFTPSFAFDEKQIECRKTEDLWACADEAWQISPLSKVLVEKLA